MGVMDTDLPLLTWILAVPVLPTVRKWSCVHNFDDTRCELDSRHTKLYAWAKRNIATEVILIERTAATSLPYPMPVVILLE